MKLRPSFRARLRRWLNIKLADLRYWFSSERRMERENLERLSKKRGWQAEFTSGRTRRKL